MSPKCDVCDGRFAANFFSDSTVCRLCFLQKENDELKKKFDILQEFVTANVGILPPLSPSTEQATSYAAVAARQNDAPSLPERVIQGEVPFTPVRNGARQINKKSFLPVSTYNSFKILMKEEEEEDHETRIIGDSIVRDQLTEFCGRNRSNRKRLCMPGGRLDDITAACDEATSQVNTNTLLIIHAGTNDVMNTRSEELLERYRKLIRRYKCKTNKIILSGILPRSSAPIAFFNRAFSTNNRLKSICTDEGIDFINCWDDFYNKPFLFKDDGLHLNQVGAARLGRLLNDKVSDFRRKNSIQPRTTSAT
ncbi:hypothetical protein ECANGB1_208 [Enterospora canceri]|uniref:SGNH hydrolase-type esterase domain-containing protein n=1 Tax=Enterospora canceri TaxID=1081671 RepID=A0A1Y1S4K0_9MICR|nr:hypothetical protein ECANGB1_208 [Enterospora canceri]